MALPATENFSSGYVAFDPLNANWTIAAGTWRIDSLGTHVEQTAGVNGFAWWNADAFGNDQYSQLVMVNTANYGGPGVRLSGTSGGTQNGYVWSANSGDLYQVVSGVYTPLASSITTPSAGDTVKLEVIGTTLKCYINGSVVKTQPGITGASTGAAGLFSFNGGGNWLGDTWQGDQIGAVGTAYTLDCQPASYAITGSALTGKRDVKMNAVAGSYVFTGVDFTNINGYVLNAQPGQYDITGFFIPGNVAAYTLDCQPGSYSFTGSATGAVNWVMNLAPGTYLITGQRAGPLPASDPSQGINPDVFIYLHDTVYAGAASGDLTTMLTRRIRELGGDATAAFKAIIVLAGTKN